MSSQLKQQLQALHQQLRETHAADAETRQWLLILLADITRLLDPDAERTEDSPTATLETLAARFDADHPALSTAMRQLIDALGKAGI
ncbi:MAG: DUF4404 family protein [Steroidobacteraceae bacterium]